MKKCIMAIGAHADDQEMRCGGTLAKYHAGGYKIVYVMMTNNTAFGLKTDCTAEHTIMTRRRETTESAALVNAEIIFLDYPEEQFQCDYTYKAHYKQILDFKPVDLSGYPETRRMRPPFICAVDMEECIEELAEILVRHEPEIILTHSSNEQNGEHWAAGMMALKAFRLACERVKLGSLYTWYYDECVTHLFTESILVDISDYIGIKIEMMKKHVSQGLDKPDNGVIKGDKLIGSILGVSYAERFKVIETGGLS